ncbi:TonB-dependent receptor [uncultured Microbulbifer sp.]|uniref:TonB-dependent receptor n=1 Tax=uncultured Microbulbifer sp. TaxID=348147 RepID=UPI0026220DDE|nr:TonB-dependent receptor [uncultured Microbulbifer sp.]
MRQNTHNNRKFFGEQKLLALVIGVAVSGATMAQESGESMEEVEVYGGSRAALANALEKQRASDKVSSVVDSDAMGNFADTNVSESLRRLPGIMVENDQGEGRYVSVRGMNTDLNAMTINGVSTASPENRRGVMLDGVPSDMLDSMTVYKTLTPNLDADTIGGAIDLETISAFKYDGFHSKVKAQTSYNELTKDANNPKLAVTATNRFRMQDGELGVAMVVSDQSRRIVARNNETGGWSDEAIDSDFEMRHYDLERERQGVVLNFDYQADSGNSYFARFFHNEYTDTEDRAKWETRSLEDDAIIEGDIATYPTQRMDTESRPRVEVRSISSAQFGGEFQLSERSSLKAEIFGSQAEQDDTNKWNAIYRSIELDTPMTYDNSDPKKPVLNYAPELYDPQNYFLKALESETALSTDQDFGLRVDMNLELNDVTELQYGIKYRQRDKDNEFDFCGYEPIDDVTLAEHDNRVIGDYFGNNHGPSPTYDGVRDLIPTLGNGSFALSDGTSCRAPGDLYEMSGDEEEESIAADWYAEENIFAGYLMATTTTDFATYVYGLRYEDTRATYRGKQFDGDAYAGDVAYDNDYGFLAPSLNVQLQLADDQILRLGAFRSLVRPGFGEASAGAKIDLEDNEIEGGNPYLDPTTAWNLDVSYEYYVGEGTFIGAGLFYKDIQDAIVEVSASDAELRGQVWDRMETTINADDSRIWGAELALQHAWDNGMLAMINYTFADGETDLPADSAYGDRSTPYVKQARNTANLAVGYDKGAWDVRLAANYRDKYLDELGDSALTDRYTSDFMQVDLTAKYEVNDNLTINAAAMNLNDRPEFYYFGNESRLSQYDEYGSTYELGFSYTY